MKRVLSLFLFLFGLHTLIIAQNVIIPGVGINNVPIRIDESNINHVIDKFGKGFQFRTDNMFSSISYDQLGLSFKFLTHDSNKIVRRIIVEAPFEAEVNNGVVRNKTTWQELSTNFGLATSGFMNGEEVFQSANGVTYVIKNDTSIKGWNVKENICKIIIHDIRTRGISRDQNYKYDKVSERKETINLINRVKNVNTYSEILKLKYSKVSMNNLFTPHLSGNYDRLVEWGVMETKILFEVGEARFQYLVISLNDSILLGKFFYNSDSILFTKENKRLKNQIFEKHQGFYGVLISTNDMYALPNWFYTYGKFCGFSGMPPAPRRVMELHVKLGNINKLREWLGSMNPEIKAYGLEGLYRLGMDSDVLNSKDIELIRYVANLQLEVDYCSGCVLGRSFLLSEVLSESELNALMMKYDSR